MKSQAEIDKARGVLAKRFLDPGIDRSQKILIMGMVNALALVADGQHCDAMQDLLDGRPMAHRQPNQQLN